MLLEKIRKVEEFSRDNIRRRKSNAPIRVVFISYLYTLWGCFASLVEEMCRRPSFDPIILPVPFIHKDLSAASKNIQHPLAEFAAKKWPVAKQTSYNIHKEQPEIAFFQSPYHNVTELKYHPDLLAVHDTRSVVIPYCTELIGDMLFQNEYFGSYSGVWRTFVASELTQFHYEHMLGVPRWNVPVMGNPEYDMVVNTPIELLPKYTKIREMAGGRRVILWNIHFELGRWCTWDTMGQAIVAALGSMSDEVFVVFRPHHLIKEYISDWQPGFAPVNYHQEVMQAMHRAGNFWLDGDGLCIESVYACDGLISDVSSLMAKAVALKKSVVMTVRQDVADLGPSRMFFEKHTHIARDIEAIKAFANMLVARNDPLLPVPQSAVEAFCGPADGKAAVRMADYLEAYFLK